MLGLRRVADVRNGLRVPGGARMCAGSPKAFLRSSASVGWQPDAIEHREYDRRSYCPCPSDMTASPRLLVPLFAAACLAIAACAATPPPTAPSTPTRDEPAGVPEAAREPAPAARPGLAVE